MRVIGPFSPVGKKDQPATLILRMREIQRKTRNKLIMKNQSSIPNEQKHKKNEKWYFRTNGMEEKRKKRTSDSQKPGVMWQIPESIREGFAYSRSYRLSVCL